jgi:HEAT repeat protein
MKMLLPWCLASVLVAADPASSSAPVPVAAAKAVPTVTLSTAEDAIALLKRLPDPLALAQLNDYFAGASSDDAGKVLVHIAISAVRPARPAVMPLLTHRDPQVVDRALRAVTVIGWNSSAAREQIERVLADGQPTVATLAATCLGSGDDLRAVPALIDKLTKGPPEVAGAALTALQRLTRVDFKSDRSAWSEWYQSYRLEAAQRLATQADLLSDPEPKKQIAAIQALAGMRGERQEALDLIEPMVRATDPTVVMAARQALATLAPSEYTMPTATEVVAVTRPGNPVQAKSDSGVMTFLSNQGLFDTWYGMLLTAFTGILILSGVLFLLRSAPVQHATRRIGRVVMAGTMRVVRPLTTRIRKGTDRIVRSFTQSKPEGNPKKPS